MIRKLKPSSLSQHLPYASIVDDKTLATKDGDLVRFVEIQGMSSAMVDDIELIAATRNFSTLLQGLNPRCGVYVHKLNVKSKQVPSSTDDALDFASTLSKRWADHIADASLKENRFVVTLCLRPKEGTGKIAGTFSRITTTQNGHRERLVKQLNELNDITNHLKSVAMPRTALELNVSSGEVLGFLGKIMGASANVALPPKTIGTMTSPLLEQPISFGRNTIAIGEGEGKKFCQILSIKNYCPETWPTILDGLNLPLEMVITNSYTPTTRTKAMRMLKANDVAMESTEDEALEDRADIVSAKSDVRSGRAGFGKHHMSIAVYHENRSALGEFVGMIKASCEEVGLILVVESVFMKEVFFGQFPANYIYRARKEYISSANYASFAALNALPAGLPTGKTPWGEPLAYLPDVTGSPYAFNFHDIWKQGSEASPGHSLIIGAVNSGKSTTAAFLAAQAVNLGSRLFVFDKDNAMEMAVRALGGKYTSFKAGKATGLNPFTTETDKGGIEWMNSWLSTLLFDEKGPSAAQRKRMLSILRESADAPKELQNFNSFVPEFNSLDDDGELFDQLSEWSNGGAYDWVFSGDEDVEFTLDDRVMGFDMSDILEQPRTRTAILSYIMRLIERATHDREPTLIVIDEVWKMLDDPYFVKFLKEWMVTMRKRNVVVLMMSQTIGHISNSDISDSIFENLTTKIIFPNASADPAPYKLLGFTEKQCELATTPTGGMRLAIVNSGESKTMLNFDLSPLGALVTTLGGGKAGEKYHGKSWRNDPNFWTGVTKKTKRKAA